MSQEAEKRWECFATLCKEMNELADEIIEWSEDGHYRDRLIHLYDLADTVFGAKNVKRLLAALEEKDQRIADAEAKGVEKLAEAFKSWADAGSGDYEAERHWATASKEAFSFADDLRNGGL